MKIGVLSDTHLIAPLPELKRLVERHFMDVDKIFHLGDFTDLSIAKYLSDQKELIAVCGNMDPQEIRDEFPTKRQVEISGFRIGLVHGGGPPLGIESRLREQFDDVDVIIYGHTHTSANHRVKKTLFFNPGSPTRSFTGKGTIGILHVEEKIEGQVIEVG